MVTVLLTSNDSFSSECKRGGPSSLTQTLCTHKPNLSSLHFSFIFLPFLYPLSSLYSFSFHHFSFRFFSFSPLIFPLKSTHFLFPYLIPSFSVSIFFYIFFFFFLPSLFFTLLYSSFTFTFPFPFRLPRFTLLNCLLFPHFPFSWPSIFYLYLSFTSFYFFFFIRFYHYSFFLFFFPFSFFLSSSSFFSFYLLSFFSFPPFFLPPISFLFFILHKLRRCTKNRKLWSILTPHVQKRRST